MVHCVNTKNGIAGGPVCQGDITVELTSGGVINSSTGVGLQANNTSNAGGTVALEGKQGNGSSVTLSEAVAVRGDAADGHGVVGTTNGTGRYGVYGKSTGIFGYGVFGDGSYAGVLGNSRDCVGILATVEAGPGGGPAGVYGSTSAADGIGVFGQNDQGIAVAGTSNQGTGVVGTNTRNTGDGVSGTGMNGVHGRGSSIGVLGESSSGTGVSGASSSDAGVFGRSDSGTGMLGISNSGVAVYGLSTESAGVVGVSQRSPGVMGFSGGQFAGLFFGDLDVIGAVSKSGGGFKIDHPMDPAKKYLSHSFVEAPNRKNIYDGVVVLDAQGEASIELPAWFEALNHDFRYQLTAIGAPAPNLHVAEEIAQNRMKIAGGKPGMKVSWQVTGIRKDAWAQANPLNVEADKTAGEQDYYRHPEAHNQSTERGIGWVQHPEIMRRLTEK